MLGQQPESDHPSNSKNRPDLAAKRKSAPASSNARKLERLAFKYGNKWLMVPLLSHGFGRFMGSPPTGYFLLLQTIGRTSHQPRVTPLNYAIDDGCVICFAGFGDHAHWLANIRTDPHVKVRLPSREFAGIAYEVKDQAEARRLAVAVARSCGFALVFEHPRCLFMSDEQLAVQLGNRPVVRIQPVYAPIVAGAYDPGGWGWLLPMLVQALALLGIIALVRRKQDSNPR